jgi:hypothetical protein
MIERTTVRLPKDLLDRARRKAAAEGRTLTSLIEDGLRMAVGEREKKSKAAKRKVELPVSSAAGGPLPGIDISDSAALQEMEDLEYVERMKHFR